MEAIVLHTADTGQGVTVAIDFVSNTALDGAPTTTLRRRSGPRLVNGKARFIGRAASKACLLCWQVLITVVRWQITQANYSNRR